LFLGGSQHRVQIVTQLDPELALLQGDRFNQSTERLRGFCACVLALERRGEILRAPVVGVRSRPLDMCHAWNRRLQASPPSECQIEARCVRGSLHQGSAWA
jgi:hypothetical protein